MKPKDIVVALLASLVGLTACGANPPAETKAGGVGQVQDALSALRRAGTATFSVTHVHRFLDSGELREVNEGFKGTYRADEGPWGDTVHIKYEMPSDDGPTQTLHRWDLGDVTVMPNPVRRDDEDSDAPPHLPWRVQPEEYNPTGTAVLTGLALIGEATTARREGSERKDGVDLSRWTVTVPAESGFEHFRSGWPGVAIDCVAGFPLAVWTDGEGRLRRLRLLIEDFNGATFDTEFAFADYGKPLSDDATPPKTDSIAGWRDPDQRAKERAEYEAAVQRGEQRARKPSPCPASEEKPTGVDRSDCSPSSLKGFELVDRRGRFTPGAKARVHYRLKEMAPAPEAFEVPEGLTVVRFGTRYIGPAGWELTRYSEDPLPPDFDPADQVAVRAMLSNPAHGETAQADIRLDTIVVEGTWAQLAAEAADCRYADATEG